MADVSLYEAPMTLEGHGRPNVFLAGEVGQKYKDLDSGLEYVCTGERGFIKVDGDDQSEMYNWELVESGGSTGGGNMFIVNITQNESGFVKDKTFDEIEEAYLNGSYCVMRINGIDIPLCQHVNNGMMFCALNCTGDGKARALSFYTDSNEHLTFQLLNLTVSQ